MFPRRPGVGVGGFEKDNLRLPVGLWILPFEVVDQHKLVGQFRPADGLALLSGGTLGPRMFPPLVPHVRSVAFRQSRRKVAMA